MKNRLFKPAIPFAVVFIILVFAETISTTASETGLTVIKPELWIKATAVFEKNKKWVPGNIMARFQMLDRKGEVDSESETRMRCFLGPKGTIETFVEKALRDGRDVTEKTRQAQEKRDKKRSRDQDDSFSYSLTNNPFNPELQDRAKVVTTEVREHLFSRNCQRFDFEYTLKPSQENDERSIILKGIAWIETETGYPVKIEFSPDPLPKRIKSLWTIFLYQIGGNGDWRISEMRIEGRGGFLFIKKWFRSQITFSDFWIYENPKS